MEGTKYMYKRQERGIEREREREKFYTLTNRLTELAFPLLSKAI